MSHRTLIAAAAAGAVALVTFAAHADSTPQPGRTIVWPSPAAAPSGAASASAAAGIPAAPRSTSAGADPLSALKGPISGLFSRLDSGAQSSAKGQYSMLTEISNTLRAWIEHLLTATTGPR
jgi:hypothetical protein